MRPNLDFMSSQRGGGGEDLLRVSQHRATTATTPGRDPTFPISDPPVGQTAVRNVLDKEKQLISL